MAISMQKARTLCTQSELSLVKWSSPRQAKELKPAQLRQKIDRARKLRDKFKDLSRKQAGEARGKRKPTGTRAAKGNERTVEKRELFEEVIARFEAALSKAEAADKKAAQAKAKAAAKKASKKAAAKKTAAKKKTTAKKKRTTKKATSDGAARAKKASTSRPATLSSSRSGSFLDGLGSSLAQQQSRETRRRSASKSSKGARERSRFARTSQEKIQGHVSSSTRRSQAKRDSK